jgi:hypothetical protein
MKYLLIIASCLLAGCAEQGLNDAQVQAATNGPTPEQVAWKQRHDEAKAELNALLKKIQNQADTKSASPEEIRHEIAYGYQILSNLYERDIEAAEATQQRLDRQAEDDYRQEMLDAVRESNEPKHGTATITQPGQWPIIVNY